MQKIKIKEISLQNDNKKETHVTIEYRGLTLRFSEYFYSDKEILNLLGTIYVTRTRINKYTGRKKSLFYKNAMRYMYFMLSRLLDAYIIEQFGEHYLTLHEKEWKY